MFNKSRLQLARRRRGMTKRRLAELINVKDRSITYFESGEHTPAPQTLARISEVLGFPESFFEGADLETISSKTTSFRSLSRMTASQRHAAEAAGILALALHDWISERFRLPEPSVPRLGPGIDPETAAEVVRAEWELGELPIQNMIHLLEVHGVRVFSLAEGTREVDAFSLYRGTTPFIFLNTEKSPEHRRMDAAHELGHLVLHSHHHKLPQGREAESEAQAFGSAFLMPRASMLASAPRLASIGNLMPHKRRWRVSLTALIYRLHAVNALSDWQYRMLNVELGKLGYRTKEPRSIRPETSQIISKVFGALRKEGVTKDDVAKALDLYPSDLDALVFNLAMLPVTGDGRRGLSPRSETPKLRVVQGGKG